MFLKFKNHHVKQMPISVGTEYKILLSYLSARKGQRPEYESIRSTTLDTE